MNKNCNVVMLPAEKAQWPNCIWLGKTTKELHLDRSYDRVTELSPIDDSMLPQHLYITSDEEIKEGDWGIKEGKYLYQVESGSEFKQYPNDKKIIATTDKSLIISIPKHNDFDREIQFPQIHESFIRAYIKAYNEGNPITNILVEYDWMECDCSNMHNTCNHNIMIPKLRSDNTIIIYQAKMYSREEVKRLMLGAIVQYSSSIDLVSARKWIEENL